MVIDIKNVEYGRFLMADTSGDLDIDVATVLPWFLPALLVGLSPAALPRLIPTFLLWHLCASLVRVLGALLVRDLLTLLPWHLGTALTGLIPTAFHGNLLAVLPRDLGTLLSGHILALLLVRGPALLPGNFLTFLARHCPALSHIVALLDWNLGTMSLRHLVALFVLVLMFLQAKETEQPEEREVKEKEPAREVNHLRGSFRDFSLTYHLSCQEQTGFHTRWRQMCSCLGIWFCTWSHSSPGYDIPGFQCPAYEHEKTSYSWNHIQGLHSSESQALDNILLLLPGS